MRLYEVTQLGIGPARSYEAYAPEPIEPEVTEVIERVDIETELDDDDEPPPLPPVPARGSRSYPAVRMVTVHPRR